MANKVNLQSVHRLLDEFKFGELFVDELGWRQPDERKPQPLELDGVSYKRRMLALLGGVGVYEIEAANGDIPDAKVRRKVFDAIVKGGRAELLLIFVDRIRSKSLWYWVKRDDKGKLYPRDHSYFKGQPGDLFVSKLVPLFFDLSDYDVSDGKAGVAVTKVAERLQQSLDVQVVTKRFYEAYNKQRIEFVSLIKGIDDAADCAWYASVLLNRLMFVYFLQKKGFVDNGDFDYLSRKLEESKARGDDRFYSEFLATLFFKGFALSPEQRDAATNALLGRIVYLNGGLFLPHPIEEKYAGKIAIPDRAFENILRLFGAYSWNLNDTPGGNDDEINPDVLGYIFEKYINQKDFGAYYTRPEITQYLCERTINKLVLDQLREAFPNRSLDNLDEVLTHLDADLCRELLRILGRLTILDPACGSGAFLVAAMKRLIDIYAAVTGRIEYLTDNNLRMWLANIRSFKAHHRSLNYYFKKQVITNNLYGVDLMEEATEIARLRLFLNLVASARTMDELEPLPNIDFNIMAGNSLIGLRRVEDTNMDLFAGGRAQTFTQVLNSKDTLIRSYKAASDYTRDPHDLQALRDSISHLREEMRPTLDGLLLDEFQGLGIKYEQATISGKPSKRPLALADVSRLEPFHWGYEFDEVIRRGGFDLIITNPPWDVLQTDEKEFFQRYDSLIQKKKLSIRDWERQREQMLLDHDIQEAWLEYDSSFAHVAAYFKSAEHYSNNRGSRKINLYAVFLEQCYNLLRDGGECGIVLPSGIYTDLGAKQLREMLFGKTEVTGLFGFENSKAIFENVHRSFKFVVLTFKKGGYTNSFPAAFMRHEVKELDGFLKGVGGIDMSVELVRRLSPDSLSLMEFSSDLDKQIAEKMLKFDLLGTQVSGKWHLQLTQELNMTTDSYLFKSQAAAGRLPLYEGKMIHQFTHQLASPRYWIDEAEGRKALLGRRKDEGQKLDYQEYRLGLRAIARNTDSRTFISTVVPRNVFCGHSILIADAFAKNGTSLMSDVEKLFYTSVSNSFTLEYLLRQMVSANISMFYIYQLPVPRYSNGDHPYFAPIVKRAAQLICTTPEFDALAQEVGIGSHVAGVTNPDERIQLRAEIDAMVAHIYGLTEAEFSHVLSTFPLVAQGVKDAALTEYQRIAPSASDDATMVALINGGETSTVEFKMGVRLNRQGQVDGDMTNNIIREVACFMNTGGGALLIGVDDTTHMAIGVEREYAAVNVQKANRDGYTLFLTDKLSASLNPAFMHFVDISYGIVSGHGICRITVKAAPAPVYVNGDFFRRDSGGCKKLNAQQAAIYIAEHWRS